MSHPLLLSMKALEVEHRHYTSARRVDEGVVGRLHDHVDEQATPSLYDVSAERLTIEQTEVGHIIVLLYEQ